MQIMYTVAWTIYQAFSSSLQNSKLIPPDCIFSNAFILRGKAVGVLTTYRKQSVGNILPTQLLLNLVIPNVFF